jgi:hypothetical protein
MLAGAFLYVPGAGMGRPGAGMGRIGAYVHPYGIISRCPVLAYVGNCDQGERARLPPLAPRLRFKTFALV